MRVLVLLLVLCLVLAFALFPAARSLLAEVTFACLFFLPPQLLALTSPFLPPCLRGRVSQGPEMDDTPPTRVVSCAPLSFLL